MAYGLRYTLTQVLRDGTTQTISIKEKDYVGTAVKSYTATYINLQPNSREEYPFPTIISTQLSFSFILETEDDFAQFPDVLTDDDKKYWVVYTIDNKVIFRGFLFNDYSQVGFTTGIQDATLIAVDGISFMEPNVYKVTDSINQPVSLLSTIKDGLVLMGYPENLNLVVACSYFADGMNTRLTGQQYEPFSQTYIYRRDFLNESYYGIIENIMRSFNCRLFQSNGDWWIMSMNEQAATTNYYTKYALPGLTVTSYGVLDTQIQVQPYQEGNVHFIDNSQMKVLKKGFNNMSYRGKFESPENFIHNADLKINDGVNAQGWTKFAASGSTAELIINESTFLAPNPYEQFNEFFISGANAYIETGSATPSPNYYLPYIIGTDSYSLSFEHKTISACKVQIQLIIGSSTRYLSSTGEWVLAVQNLNLESSGDNEYKTANFNLPKYSTYIQTFFGYIKVKILSNGGTSNLKNFRIQLNDRAVQYVEVNYNPDALQESTLKVFEQPYGNTYPTQWEGVVNSYTYVGKGLLCNASGDVLVNWKSVVAGSLLSAPILITFMMYQQLKLSNGNIANLECDLGNYTSTKGFIGLDKTFSVTDTTTGYLSYNGKKFMINRMSLNSYINETNSIQMIEVTNTSPFNEFFFLFPKYVTDSASLQPFWDLQLNIF